MLLITSLLSGVAATGWVTARAAPPAAPEALDGSFRLENGEVITGGYFVEEARGRYLYLDAGNPGRGGLFEPVSTGRLRSIVPDGRIEIEFLGDPDRPPDRIVWREAGLAPLKGVRVAPHDSRPVGFASRDGTRLEGRLLVPDCPGPHPVVVSVHGSGPVNRYGGPYHTWFLTRGIAVLAYDKRGYTEDAGAWREPDLAVLAADAAAAVGFASVQPGLDPRRVGLVGSSQAGWVVPRAAVEAPETAFVVLRAGAATSHWETSLHEVRQELRAAGLEGLDLDNAVGLRREIYLVALGQLPLSATDPLVRPYLHEPWYRTAFGAGPISDRWSSRWWSWAQRNLATSAVPWLERFDGPVLWFLAELDENVPLVPTRAALQRAFAASPGDDQEIVLVEDASHSFLVQAPGEPPRLTSGFFEPMGRWLAARGLTDPACSLH